MSATDVTAQSSTIPRVVKVLVPKRESSKPDHDRLGRSTKLSTDCLGSSGRNKWFNNQQSFLKR